MAYGGPNVAAYPTLPMLVHSEGSEQRRYSKDTRTHARTHAVWRLSLVKSLGSRRPPLPPSLRSCSLQESEEPFVSEKQLAGNDAFHWF